MRWKKGDATYYGFPGKDFEEELRSLKPETSKVGIKERREP
jgi:hypothetical protein